jgi:hypothetical protein
MVEKVWWKEVQGGETGIMESFSCIFVNTECVEGFFENYQGLYWTEGVIWRKIEGLSVKLEGQWLIWK